MVGGSQPATKEVGRCGGWQQPHQKIRALAAAPAQGVLTQALPQPQQGATALERGSRPHSIMANLFFVLAQTPSGESSIPLSLKVDDIEAFVLQPCPQGSTVQCRITRDRKGMDKGIFPFYYLHLEMENGKKVSANRK